MGTRAQKTKDKTARGGLPAPANDVPTLSPGRGAPCRGCGEGIAPQEKLYSVKLLGALILDFHAECYESWRTFKPGETKANTA
jgi:hypothetical protein